YTGEAILTGWGAQNPVNGEDPNYPNRMKYVNLPLLSTRECQKYYNVDDSQVCAGGVNGQNSCRGDSGGPLVKKSGNWYIILGLSSYGPIQCASGEKYAGEIGTPDL
ncbi:chymotrypsin-like protease CTRL-1, partial [Leptotrombidium deliense]